MAAAPDVSLQTELRYQENEIFSLRLRHEPHNIVITHETDSAPTPIRLPASLNVLLKSLSAACMSQPQELGTSLQARRKQQGHVHVKRIILKMKWRKQNNCVRVLKINTQSLHQAPQISEICARLDFTAHARRPCKSWSKSHICGSSNSADIFSNAKNKNTAHGGKMTYMSCILGRGLVGQKKNKKTATIEEVCDT